MKSEKLKGSYAKRTQNRLRRCAECKTEFESRKFKRYCSVSCQKERTKKYQASYKATDKQKLIDYTYAMKLNYNNKADNQIIKKYKQTLIREKLLWNEIQKRNLNKNSMFRV